MAKSDLFKMSRLPLPAPPHSPNAAKPVVASDFPESFGSRQDDLLLNCLAVSTDRQRVDQSCQMLGKALSSWQPCVVSLVDQIAPGTEEPELRLADVDMEQRRQFNPARIQSGEPHRFEH